MCVCVCVCDDYVCGWGLWRQTVCVRKREQRGRDTTCHADISPVAVKFKPPSLLTPWATAALPLQHTHTLTLGRKHTQSSDGTIWPLTEDWALGSLWLSLRRGRAMGVGTIFRQQSRYFFSCWRENERKVAPKLLHCAFLSPCCQTVGSSALWAKYMSHNILYPKNWCIWCLWLTPVTSSESRWTVENKKDQNRCGRTRDIVYFIPRIPCQTLVPTLPTMQLSRWVWSVIWERYAISS